MTASEWLRLGLLAWWLAAAGWPMLAHGAQPAAGYEPYVGQDGKDVVWVPTPQALVNRMLDLAKLGPDDYLIDLGSGDGRTVITAAKRGARALGIEYNADMVALARRKAREAGVADRAEFIRADLFQTDLSKATVITMFLLPEINLRLRPTLLKLEPGTRVVSNSFRMGNWKPDATATVRRDCTEYCAAHLWIVPARVAGKWQTPEGTLTLRQRFQYFTGTLKGADTALVTRGKITGDAIVFAVGHTRYAGRVAGDTIELTATSPAESRQWVATRQ